MFATVADLQALLGRDLTGRETTQAALVLGLVAGLIRGALGKPANWMPAPVPGELRALSLEKALGKITNPTNLAAESEQLGAYQHSQTFQRAIDGGVFLTEAEKREVRRAAGVAAFASVTMVSPYSGDEETSPLDFDFPLGS